MKNRLKCFLVTALVLSGTLLWWSKKPMSPLELPTRVDHKQPPIASAIASPQSIPISAEPSITPSPTDAGQKKFVDMPSSECRAIIREIKKKDLVTIFQLFLDAGRMEHDPMKQSAIQGVFTQALKSQQLPPDFLEKMRRFVTDKSNSYLERGSIVSAFASAGTKEGTEFVLWAAAAQPDQELKNGAIGDISYLGSGGDREYLPSKIAPIWNETKDVRLLQSVANAMAKEGAPSSIELLFSAALAPDGQDDLRRNVAREALQAVYTGNAVPPLAAALEKNPVGSRANTLAFTTLAQIVDKKADQALMGWLQTNDGSAASMAKEWIAHAKTPSQLVAAKAALDPSVPFRNEANREALRAGIEAYKAGHTTER
jgi:hypothetical protein